MSTPNEGAPMPPRSASSTSASTSCRASPTRPGPSPSTTWCHRAGRPAEFGFNAAGLGIPVHLLPKIRSDGDYGLSSETLDIVQFGGMSGVSVELWGDPSDPSHDFRRGTLRVDLSPEKPAR